MFPFGVFLLRTPPLYPGWTSAPPPCCLSQACQRYLAHKETQNKAWEGASLKDKVSGITRSHTGRQNHMQLQRRLTNPRIANHHK